MLKLKRGLTTDEIQKVLADLDEIFDDSDCELENEEDDLDQSLNLNPEVVSEEQIRKITEETNIYATRVLQSATPSSLRKHNPGWTETNEEEIQTAIRNRNLLVLDYNCLQSAKFVAIANIQKLMVRRAGVSKHLKVFIRL
ncbi:hypothetical protein TNCV_2266811 [Trichonephila clavipes]|nr:hypothetical protein TNCV_2266811 [Trichonephila clavipes]